MKKQLCEEFKRMQKLAGLINEASISDKGELEDFDFENDLIVEYTPEYYQNIKNWKGFYCEKGLGSGFEIKDNKKVKIIVGYSLFLDLPDDKKWIWTLPDPSNELWKYLNADNPADPEFSVYDDDEDDDYDLFDEESCRGAEEVVIGYIYSKSGKDIETEYTDDELYDAFYDSLEA